MFDLSLDDIRRAGKATEGSVNDVFVAAVVGGLHRYHERHGDVPDVAAHDAADQPAPRAATTPAATASRRPASRCRPTIADPAERVQAIRALVRQWRAEPALQLTEHARRRAEPPADRRPPPRCSAGC